MMNKKHAYGIFIFRQDLRITDNHWFFEACKQCEKIIPLFILDTTILEKFPKNDKRLHFQYNALYALHTELKRFGSSLYVIAWKSITIIKKLIEQESFTYLWRNRSYWNNAQTRDRSIKKLLKKYTTITLNETTDYLLVEPEKIPPMKVFTPYYNRWLAEPKHIGMYTPKSIPKTRSTLKWKNYDLIDPNTFKTYSHPYWPVHTSSYFQNILPIAEYDASRNFPAKKWWTARLSPYLAFWIVSVRQILWLLINSSTPWVKLDNKWVSMDKKTFNNSFVSELAWREFWQQIAYHFPESIIHAFLPKYRHIERTNNKEHFEARKQGNTWYPIVDAAMKQLLTENWMHGRCRMIVASFLTKDLQIDWKRWEEHFKNYLLDYDRNINIGNRQRSASVWADPKPLRIFNPILQSKKFDPQWEYIIHWIHELAWQPIPGIHDPLTYKLNYTQPIINHYEETKITRELYKNSYEKYHQQK